MNSTIDRPVTLGRISPNRMYGVRSLRRRAAETYSSSRSWRTAARTVREMIGRRGGRSTRSAVVFDGPSATITSRAMIIDRQRQERLDDPAQHVVHGAAEVAGDQAQRGPEHRGEDRCQRRDDEDVARADDDAREDVAAELVGAEPVVGRRRSRGR